MSKEELCEYCGDPVEETDKKEYAGLIFCGTECMDCWISDNEDE